MLAEYLQAKGHETTRAEGAHRSARGMLASSASVHHLREKSEEAFVLKVDQRHWSEVSVSDAVRRFVPRPQVEGGRRAKQRVGGAAEE